MKAAWPRTEFNATHSQLHLAKLAGSPAAKWVPAAVDKKKLTMIAP
jgi:hypothetical protein